MLSNPCVALNLEFLTFRFTKKILETIHIFEIQGSCNATYEIPHNRIYNI